jgi:hypothetical protein
VKKKHFIFIIQNNNKNKKTHKNKKNKKVKSFLKKLKHEPSLKKPGDFTVAEGHGHPLVQSKGCNSQQAMYHIMVLPFIRR